MITQATDKQIKFHMVNANVWRKLKESRRQNASADKREP